MTTKNKKCRHLEDFNLEMITPKCDYHGVCKNKAYKEVYYKCKHKDKKCLSTSHWNYLCRKHFEQENKKYFKKDKAWFYCSV